MQRRRAHQNGSPPERRSDARAEPRRHRAGHGPASPAPTPTPGQAALITLQRQAGNRAVAGLVHARTRSSGQGSRIASRRALTISTASRAVIQRQVPLATMTDDYFTAYDNRMALPPLGRYHQLAPAWWAAYVALEARLDDVRNGLAAYDDANVQQAHADLLAAGLQPVVVLNARGRLRAAGQAMLAQAATRWGAYRDDDRVNRGAWAGSARHGRRPADYVRTSAATIGWLRDNVGNTPWWLMQSDTAPSGWALHRGGPGEREDFIFHL